MPNHRILIVEDEALVAMDLQETLQDMGYEVPAIVYSGEEALDQIAAIRPDLVLMDIQLAGAIDGIEAATQIRDRYGIPLIYVTANSDEATFQHAKVTAPSGYILKPIRKKELGKTIDLALTQHQRTVATRQLLAAVVESSHDAIISVDLNGVISTWNEGAQKIYGYAASQAIGHSLSMLYPHDDDETTQLLTRVKRGERVEQHETIRVRNDGHRFNASLTLSPVRDDRNQIIGASSIDRDITERVQTEEALRQAREELELRVEERTAELQDTNERLKREMAERKMAEKEVVRLERLRALGELASGISHNLNNLLVGILGPAEALLGTTDPAEIREWAELIYATGERAAGLVKRLNQAVRDQPSVALEPVNVEMAIREAIQTARTLWREQPARLEKKIEIATHLKPVPPIQGTGAGLRDALVNLLLNAGDAMPHGGHIELATELSGDQVLIRVTDDGIGMGEDTLRKVFEPFFTTKSDVGSGLGLTTAHRTITLWNGQLNATSSPGAGSIFTAHLAIWNANTSSTAHCCQILVVEDDQAVIHVLRKRLTPDYKVEFALDGNEALVRFDPNRHQIALVDWSLPGLSGDQVDRHIRQHQPATVLVLMTGWDVEQSYAHLGVFDLHLQKPFNLETVDQILAQAHTLYQQRSAQ